MQTTTNHSMAQAKLTLTVRELARILGTDTTAVYNAKNNKRKTIIPGTKTATVLSGMANMGITWDQIVPAPAPIYKSAGLSSVSFADPEDAPVPVSETDAASKGVLEAPEGELSTGGFASDFDNGSLGTREDLENLRDKAGAVIGERISLETLLDDFHDAFFVIGSKGYPAYIPINMLASMHIEYADDGSWNVVCVTVSGKEYKAPGFDSLGNARSFCENQMEEVSAYNKACATGKG